MSLGSSSCEDIGISSAVKDSSPRATAVRKVGADPSGTGDLSAQCTAGMMRWSSEGEELASSSNCTSNCSASRPRRTAPCRTMLVTICVMASRWAVARHSALVVTLSIRNVARVELIRSASRRWRNEWQKISCSVANQSELEMIVDSRCNSANSACVVIQRRPNLGSMICRKGPLRFQTTTGYGSSSRMGWMVTIVGNASGKSK